MQEIVKVELPKLGESIVGATVVRVFKKEGDVVEADEALLEVSTDKVNSEIPSPLAGIIRKVLVTEGQEVAVGEILFWIEKRASQQTNVLKKESEKSHEKNFSPAVLNYATEKGISLEELEKISGTGENGRVSKRDLEAYLNQKHSESLVNKSEERIKIAGVRKAIAENLLKSYSTVPQASLWTEIDVTDLLHWIEREKEQFFAKNGAKLSITSVVAWAIARAVLPFPLINSSIEGEEIVIKKEVHLGIAVNRDQEVLVPVIHHAQKHSIAEIAKEIFSLAKKVREQMISQKEIEGGTLTLTNFGMTGISMGIPILRYPEAAIVSMGAIVQRVVPLKDQKIGIASVVNVGLTFDHRIFDGIYGCGFLNEVKRILESGQWKD